MLILGDEGHYHGRFPWVTTALVVINVFVYTVQCLLGEPFTVGYSMTPAEITKFRDLTGVEYAKVHVPVGTRRGYDTHGSETLYGSISLPIQHYPGPQPVVLTMFTCVFLHGSLMHLIGNMWFLLVFGRNVECALDHGRFLAFYLTCGTLAGIAHILSDPNSVIPCLGASGAISGVMGAYVAIHPMNRVKIWLGWLFGVIEVPALLVIGLWFLFQYIAVCQSLENPAQGGGVAYWAHIGGFVAGLGIIWSMVLYLKYRVAQQATETENTAFSANGPAESTRAQPGAVRGALADPFDNFMPPPLSPQDELAKKG
jgi:membrane associated rhomboid family serine protease